MPMLHICVTQLALQLRRDPFLSLCVAASSNKLVFVVCKFDRRVGQCLADCMLSLAIVRSSGALSCEIHGHLSHVTSFDELVAVYSQEGMFGTRTHSFQCIPYLTTRVEESHYLEVNLTYHRASISRPYH